MARQPLLCERERLGQPVEGGREVGRARAPGEQRDGLAQHLGAADLRDRIAACHAKASAADKRDSLVHRNRTIENTLEGMARAEGKKVSDIPLVEGAKLVPAGIVQLLELSEQGWTIVRP